MCAFFKADLLIFNFFLADFDQNPLVTLFRCTMDNYHDHAVWVGATREDEMCNFYLMYWVDGKEILEMKKCNSVGPPLYAWGNW